MNSRHFCWVNSMKDRKKPAIRFKGFTEDWEQRKLGDCFTERVESMPDGELISVTIKDGIKKFSELGRHDNSNDDKSKYKKVCVGDIAYNSMRMWQGASGYSPYEGIVSPAYTVISPNLGIYSKCLAYQFKLPEMIRTFQVNSQGITSDNWNLKYPALSQIEIFVSKDEEEQTQIAEYFANLDNLITLHQRKYDKLVNIKKSMLEKMFPRDGKIVPDIRFSGFTEDWEQRKVGEFLTESRVRGNTGLDAKKLTVKLWGKGVVEKNDFGGSEHTQYFTRRKGQFIYSKLDFLNSAFGVIPEKLDNYESTTDLPAFDLDGMNPYFMYFVAIQESFYLKHGSIADGSRKAKRIHADTFLNMPVMVPTIDEQNLIVDFLQHLDNLITLHQRKLEKLKNIKKSCLEKMFI